MSRLMVFSGNANPELASEIARTLGIPLGDALVSLFSDGEINIEIREMFAVMMYLWFNPPVHQPIAI